MLRIVCIHRNANYSQSEILNFQIFFGGGYGAKNLFPHCMPVKFPGHTDLPFFIPAELTALLTANSSMNYSNKYKVLYVLCFYL